MPKVEELFPTRFLSAADIRKLKDPNTPFVIKNVQAEECIHPKTRKPSTLYVIYFQGGVKKAHRIRKSEVKKLAVHLGATTEEWGGKVVRFRLAQTTVGAGVRIIPDGDKTSAQPADDLGIDPASIPNE